MASETLLLVLILREAGLRSTLVARLSMAGADVLTADHFDDPRLVRHKKRPLVLIADDTAVESYPGGCDALLEDPRWFRLVVLAPGDCDASRDPRLIHVQRKNAARTIVQLLPKWQAQPAF